MLLLATLLQATAPCPATPAASPADLAGWTTKVALKTGRAATPLTISKAARAALLPAATVTLPATPGKPAATGSHSGVFEFTAPATGRYRVALSAGAWLDVVVGGKALTSVAHGHGPACTGIRKMVDFDLKPGRHLLQVVGSPTPTVDLMVAQLN